MRLFFYLARTRSMLKESFILGFLELSRWKDASDRTGDSSQVNLVRYRDMAQFRLALSKVVPREKIITYLGHRRADICTVCGLDSTDRYRCTCARSSLLIFIV